MKIKTADGDEISIDPAGDTGYLLAFQNDDQVLYLRPEEWVALDAAARFFMDEYWEGARSELPD